MEKQNIVLLGPPGSGKGAQAKLLTENGNLIHFSTGDALRAEMAMGTDLGKEITELMNSGQYVPDKTVIEVVREKMERDGKTGIVFDGFPRTLEQAVFLNEATKIDFAININVSDEIIIHRMLERGRKAENPRPEDLDETIIAERIKIYNENSKPIVSFYKLAGRLVEINGEGTPEEVDKQIQESISELSV